MPLATPKSGQTAFGPVPVVPKRAPEWLLLALPVHSGSRLRQQDSTFRDGEDGAF